MSGSKLFFPEVVVVSFRHHMMNLTKKSTRVHRGLPAEPEQSAPVRMGPLEFKITAQHTDHGEKVSVVLRCSSVLRGFPWRGVVFAEVRTLKNAESKTFGCLYPMEIYVSSNQELEEFEFSDWSNPFRAFDDCIHFEIFLKINVKIGLNGEEGSCGWKVPSAVLCAPIPTLTSGAFPEPKDGDLNIVSKEGEKFPAHRWILEWSSPVFKTMLSTEMREKAEGTINMKLGTNAVKVLVKFLYTGGFKEEMESLEEYGVEDFLEVVDAGGMYELPLLMKLAGVALLLRCQRENVWDLFTRLKKYGDAVEETMTSLADFVQSNVHAMAKE